MASVSNTSNSTTSPADIFAAINNQNKGTSTSSTSAAETENRFLTLLVTQLKNQDPLNPLDNAQVTSQMAQINTVSGIEKLNATLGKLLSAYDDSKSVQSAGMIGKNVLVPGSDLKLTANGAAAGVLLDSAADRVLVTISDSTGKEVNVEDLGAKGAGSFAFVWDGKDADGKVLPAGKYTFTVEATKGGNKVTSKALEFGTVSALVRSGNGFQLDLGEGGLVGFDDVQQIL
ncbi:MAG TPA: flagellar hook assembly protein FlgD [Rhodocyclaceae bacterium]|nr:flagellar hook assembly protein FlgD [Rhodocyclaceae bacterium]